MRALPAAAVVLGVIVLIWELPYIFTKTSLWPVLMMLALAVVLLAVEQVRHGGK